MPKVNFKLAHAITDKVIQPNDDYKITFGETCKQLSRNEITLYTTYLDKVVSDAKVKVTKLFEQLDMFDTESKLNTIESKYTEDTNHVVSFSGGRTSAYMCKLIKEKFKNVSFVYCDTGLEHPKTYEFIKKVDKEFDLNLTCIKVVINPTLGSGNSYEIIKSDELKFQTDTWLSMTKKYSNPYNPSGGFCTGMLKSDPFKKYCQDKFGKKNFITWLGIRADEPRRLKEKVGFDYLASISDFDRDDVIDFWSNQNFDLEIPKHLGNCVFCIKKPNNTVALACRDEPELAKKMIDVIYHKDVRDIEKRKVDKVKMYRGNQSLIDIVEINKNVEHQNLANRVKRLADNECSESCEVFK